ncbi:MAG: hypothetical protein J6O60_04295 [Lachnospiraceae bacterium]|nr:hypothetical protein [Lachnospiraceae bacterium]
MMDKKTEIRNIMLSNIIFCFAIAVCTYQGVVRSYNSTMLALSYRYGFTSRSLLGSIYHLLNDILPINMMDYSVVLVFAVIVTACFYALLFYFMYFALKRCQEEYFKPLVFILFLLNVVTVATFTSSYNFFRVDLFMMAVAIISAIVMIKDKAVWMMLPISCIGVMFHQGFVFMYFNIALVLLICRFFDGDKKAKIKYGVVFALTFAICSGLFLWFELFSRTNGAAIINDVLADARAVSLDGHYHSTLLQHEVLGVDLAEDEWEWHKMNIMQMGFFVVLSLPWIWIAIDFFKGIFKGVNSRADKIKYFFVAAGALTMLPDYLLKIDYGRWVMSTIAYYAIVIVSLVAMGDLFICKRLLETYEKYKSKSWSLLLFVYPIMFIPFNDVDIDGFMQQLSAWLNGIVGFFSF